MPLMVKVVTDVKDEVTKQQIIDLYNLSPEFADGEQAVNELSLLLADGNAIYVGEFNEKIIAAVWAIRQNATTTMLQYIMVHPANRGRGIAEMLCEQACKQEEQRGTLSFVAGCGAIRRVLVNIDKI